MILSNRSLGKALMAAAAGFALLGTPAAAEMPKPDAEFDQRVRDALLRNPDIILEVFALLEQKEETAQAGKDQELIARVAGELFAGLDPEKPILVEFQDYNCGYCRRAHPVVASLLESMPDLQLVLLETPVLGKESTFAAKTALAVKALKGEEAYREFADAMMSMQGPTSAVATIRTLTELGHEAGEISAAVKEGVGAEDLEKAKRLAAALGATGTPYFAGPGGIIRGAASADQLRVITTAPQTRQQASH